MPPQQRKIVFLHIPRTGGVALESYLYCLRPDDPYWFFSFFGLDSPQNANRVVIESMTRGDKTHLAVRSNVHFQLATVVAGHVSRNHRP